MYTLQSLSLLISNAFVPFLLIKNRVDAQTLIDAYRGEKQEEFNSRVLAAGGTGGSASAKLQAETNNDIQAMQGQFQSNAQKATDVLLSKCCEVSLEVPTARVRATQKAYGVAN